MLGDGSVEMVGGSMLALCWDWMVLSNAVEDLVADFLSRNGIDILICNEAHMCEQKGYIATDKLPLHAKSSEIMWQKTKLPRTITIITEGSGLKYQLPNKLSPLVLVLLFSGGEKVEENVEYRNESLLLLSPSSY